MRALLLAGENTIARVYGPQQLTRLAKVVDLEVYSGDYSDMDRVYAAVHDKEALFSTWGMKTLDQRFLAAAPHLKAVFYAAGSVRGFVTEAFWRRGIVLSSAWGANAVPVAEMSLSLIMLSLKRYFQHAAGCTERAGYRQLPVAGGYGSVVGLIGMGMIGRKVRELLRCIDVQVIAHDPYMAAERAEALGVELVTLDELFRRSDVVSLHAPNIPETRHMVKAEHFGSMKPGATFINTARGALVDEAGMVEVLAKRPDLWALLDVTDPEPPVAESPLYKLPNVVLTPHIAGSMDNECRRMADYMIDECERYLSSQPLLYQVTEEMMQTMA